LRVEWSRGREARDVSERRIAMKRFNVLVLAVAVSFGAVLLVPASPVPAAEQMDMEKMISAAKTADDHKVLATEYEKQAAEAKAKAAEHRKMAESYKQLGGGVIGKQHLDEHCERLARSYESAAKEYAAMANAELALAKESK
jgi:hypothetical protein